MRAAPTPPPVPVHLLVLAKHPRPGQVKTRLSPPLSPAQAARVASACLEDTLDAALAARAARTTLVTTEPDAAPRRPGLHRLPQRDGGLDRRLAGAFDDARADDPAGLPLLLVGMDTPQVGPAELTAAAQALTEPACDAVLGRAHDGGFWALGLGTPDPSLLLGVPMSTPATGDAQAGRLRAAGLRTTALRTHRDVDTVQDLQLVAASAPGTRTAALGRLLLRGAA